MTVYIVDIESVDTRYTKQWKEYLPGQIANAVGVEVQVISGGDTPQATTPGAFLNFGGTNVYKSNQLEQIATMFCNGAIKNGDYFLYTDAWNPTVIQLKYMAKLLKVDVKIGGLWHAGSYDPQDFLGRLIGDEPWVRYAERSMFEIYDHNFFATEFHIDIFTEAFFKEKPVNKIKRIGWPMEYLEEKLAKYRGLKKRNLILFPHRLAPEKQPEIFRDLKVALPQYEFILCQEKELTKDQYHTLLSESKIVFSANLQETLGISWYEGVIVQSIPMVPNRLSYKEMALDQFKYPTEWTTSFTSYVFNKDLLIQRIVHYMENYNNYINALDQQHTYLQRNYFNGIALYNELSSIEE